MEMSAKNGFAFRQRAGRIDWRLISAVDVDEILLRVKVDELQTLLDTITFSEFDKLDVRSNSVENVAKLVHLMQLIIEYLLHHQESQFETVRKLSRAQRKLSISCKSYQASLSAAKEEVRMYQKQLHILRKAVQSGGGGVNTELMFRLLQQPPKVVIPTVSEEKEQAAKAQNAQMVPSLDLVKVILDHEHEARMVINSMLENQRETFAKEIQSLHESIRKLEHEKQLALPAAHEANQLTAMQLALDNVKLQLEQSMRQIADKLKDQTVPQSSFSASPRGAASRRIDEANSTPYILRSAALESMTEELHQRERLLSQRELVLQKREEALVRRELTSKNARDLSASNHPQNAGIQRLFATKLLWLAVIQVVKRVQIRAFRRWLTKTFDTRLRVIVDDHAKQLVFAANKRSGAEDELRQQLVNEQQNFAILQARFSTLTREVDALREFKQLHEDDHESKMKFTEDMAAQLKAEREKAIIATAKLNALQKKQDKEKLELMEKLRMAEEIIASGDGLGLRDSSFAFKKQQRDANVMTSQEFSTPKADRHQQQSRDWQREDAAVGTSMVFRDESPLKATPESLLRYEDEETMLRVAHNRILSKNSREEVQQVALASLAQDFMVRFK